MTKFKVTCTEDNKVFVVTSAFSKLYKKFKDFKNQRGRIILIIGSPGTGKSSNIYHALNILDIKEYDVELKLSGIKISPQKVFEEFISTLKRDFNTKTKEESYNEFSKFDTILFADKLLESGDLNKNRIELSEWLRYNRFKSIILYLIMIKEFLMHLNYLNKVNLVFHLTWTFIFKNKKYDILSDFSLLSILLTGFLKVFFEVVEIKYTELETIEIVKTHFEGVNDTQIKHYIRKYGNRPRYILEAIDNNLITLKATHSNIKSAEPVCKQR